MKTTLTDAAVLAAPLDSETQDAKQSALRLVVSPKGKRVWMVYFWNPATKRPQRKVLGLAGDDGLTVKAARVAATALLAEAAKPGAVPRRKVPTFADVVDSYGTPWVKREFNGRLKPWRDLPLDKLTREMVEMRERLILVEAGEEQRRRDHNAGKPQRASAGVHSVTVAAKALRMAYKIAARKRLHAGENMGSYMTLTATEPRLRVLTKAEERRFLAALDSPALQPWVRPFFLLLKATGVRWGNCIAARFEEFDLDDAAWTVPPEKSKNGRPMRVMLSAQAVAIVKERAAAVDSPWLFQSPQNPDAHLTDIHWQWRIVKSLADLEGITPHDIRRTFGSRLISAGTSLDIVSSMMGHKSSATTQKYYAHVSDEAKRAALMNLN